MTKPDNYYDSSPLRRTLDELQECIQKSKGENYCCIHQPLINIPLDHIILDELHLMLWVTDVLIGNLIENVMQWDEKESFLIHTGNKKNPSRQTNTSHKQLWGVIFSLGKTKCRWQRVWDLGLDKFDGGWPKNTPKKPSLQIGTTTTAGHS